MKNLAIIFIMTSLILSLPVYAKNLAKKRKSEKIKKIIKIPIVSPKSPILLISIALIAALFAEILVYQKFINK